MKTILAIAVLALAGCTTTKTTTKTGKTVVVTEEQKPIEWLAAIGSIFGNVLAASAAEQFRADPSRVGLRK